jgi:hypothetical protein
MNFGKELKKAMIDKGIGGAKELSEVTGMTYGKVNRILNSDGSSRIVDIAELGAFFKIELTWQSFE